MNQRLVHRFIPFLRPYRGYLILALGATLLIPLLNAAKVWLLKLLIDEVLRRGQVRFLPWICAAYLGITLGKALASFVDDDVGGWVGSQVVRDLRSDLFDHLQGLSLHFYHRYRLGDLLTRLTGDIAAIEDLLVSLATDAVAQVLTVALFVGLLFYLDPSLALVALLVVPALAHASVAYARRSRAAQKELRDATSALTSTAEESLSAIALIKAFAREPFELGRFDECADRSRRGRRRSIRLRASFNPLFDLLATIGTILVVWFGAHAVLTGQLSIGGLVVFLGYLGSLYTPIQGLSRLGGVVQRALVGAERVGEILDADPVLQERRGKVALESARGLVRFEDVSFGYTPSQPVLRGFNLTINPGEVVALVGASGAGKTTVVSLLLAYYDCDSGSVSIDGQDLRSVDPRAVRRNVAAVLQEPMLFPTSIRDNIRYGRLDATDADVEEAARAAGAEEFIRRLPEGLDTLAGPRGGRLSGGQRQRVAIARALVKRAPIVVLDEATSALDGQTEARVLEALRHHLAGRAVLLVAHRQSTIKMADRIVVLQDGRVADTGSYAEISQRPGPFQDLYGVNGRAADPVVAG